MFLARSVCYVKLSSSTIPDSFLFVAPCLLIGIALFVLVQKLQKGKADTFLASVVAFVWDLVWM